MNAYAVAYGAIPAALLVGWHALAGAVDKAAVAGACCAFFALEARGHRVLGWFTRRALAARASARRGATVGNKAEKVARVGLKIAPGYHYFLKPDGSGE